MNNREAAQGLMMAFAAEAAMDQAKEADGPIFGRVREVILQGGTAMAKFALNWRTGEWVRVREAEPYPPECYQEIPRLRDSRDIVVRHLLSGLTTAGAHHKQWALEEAFRALCEDKYVDEAKSQFQWETGLPS